MAEVLKPSRSLPYFTGTTLAERGFACYTPTRMYKKLCESHAFEVSDATEEVFCVLNADRPRALNDRMENNCQIGEVNGNNTQELKLERTKRNA